MAKKNKADKVPTFVLKKEYLVGVTGSIVSGCDDRTQEFEFKKTVNLDELVETWKFDRY
jgi:hypothetical protein